MCQKIPRARDIDYAAVTVRNAITEKFGQQTSLENLEVEAGESTISVRDEGRSIAGSRDDLLSSIRKAATWDEFWALFPNSSRSPR